MGVEGRFAECDLPSVLRRADDVPGAWVAACIPLGVVTQGDSLPHALEMLADAIDVTVDDDLARDMDPLRRQPLPGSTDELAQLLSSPLVPVEPESLDESVSVVIAFVRVVGPKHPAMEIEGLALESLSRIRDVRSPLVQLAS